MCFRGLVDSGEPVRECPTPPVSCFVLGVVGAVRPEGLALDACAAHGTTAGARDGRQGRLQLQHIAAYRVRLQRINADCGGLRLFTVHYSALHLERDPL